MARPSDTAGLKWPPEMPPTAYAMVSTARPAAKPTPMKPTPTVGNPAAIIAVPSTAKQSQKVPKNSAKSLRAIRQMPHEKVSHVSRVSGWRDGRESGGGGYALEMRVTWTALQRHVIHTVIPSKAGIQAAASTTAEQEDDPVWIPAFAGMTWE